MSELFPIMVPRYTSELPGFLKELREAGVAAMVVGIPWEIIEPHEAQARANHGGQSLRQLADRGGLSPAEALAVMADQPFAVLRSHEQAEAYRQLLLAILRASFALPLKE